MPSEPSTGLTQRYRGVGGNPQAREASIRTSDSLRVFWEASIVGGRRYPCNVSVWGRERPRMPYDPNNRAPWEVGGEVKRGGWPAIPFLGPINPTMSLNPQPPVPPLLGRAFSGLRNPLGSDLLVSDWNALPHERSL